MSATEPAGTSRAAAGVPARGIGPAPFGRPLRHGDWRELDGLGHSGRSISVIVIHHEQPAQLERTLLALLRPGRDGPPAEIIVVDDGSATPPAVPPGVRLLRQEREGARRSAARNRGAWASHGELLCFLDADTAPEPAYLAELTRLPSLAPEVVAVGLRRHADFTGVAADTPVEAAGPDRELPRPDWLSREYRESENLRRAGEAGFRGAISAVLGVSSWLFQATGGFDERFVAYGGEDWEWAHRAWLSGAAFAHVPGAVAWHDGPDWSARGPDARGAEARRREKNRESRRLAELIGVAGQRPRGMWARRPEVRVDLRALRDVDSAFITGDSLLEALPRAEVVVAADLLDELAVADPRVRPAPAAGDAVALHLTVCAGVQVRDAHALAELCTEMRRTDSGPVRLDDAAGELIHIETGRHRARAAAWGAAVAQEPRRLQPPWLRRLPDPPDVEAYLGGWER